MVSNIVLNDIIRENLQVITKTQRALDRTSLRLATGLKVNSALDNPDSFFTSRTLKNRSNDLQKLLDNINLSLRTLEEADNAVTGVDRLLLQAEQIAQEADSLSVVPLTKVRIQGDVNIGASGDITSIAGISAGDRIQVQARTPDQYLIVASNPVVTITAGMTAQDLAAAINAITLAPVNGTPVQASIQSGRLVLETTVDNSILFVTFLGALPGGVENPALGRALGFGDLINSTVNGVSGNAEEPDIILTANNTLTSVPLVNNITSQTAQLTDRMNNTRFSGGGLTTFGINGFADQLGIGINEETEVRLPVGALTIGGFIDAINNDGTLNQFIQASFLNDTGQIVLTKISDELDTVTFSLDTNDIISAFYFGFAFNLLLKFTPLVDTERIRILGEAVDIAELQELEDEYNKILVQLEELVEDAEFLGIQLLKGENLTTFFNEDLSTSLTIEGVDFSPGGLGLPEADFSTKAGTEQAVEKTADAIDQVQSFSQVIANQVAVITARRNFTEITINTLDAGAQELVIADQNEEGANLIALETRQLIATSALSLGAQAQQAVNSLFTG